MGRFLNSGSSVSPRTGQILVLHGRTSRTMEGLIPVDQGRLIETSRVEGATERRNRKQKRPCEGRANPVKTDGLNLRDRGELMKCKLRLNVNASSCFRHVRFGSWYKQRSALEFN